MTTRILIATALTTVLATGTAAAYQTAPPAKPPATQTPPVKPPATQTPPPAQTPPPLLPTAPKPPAPVLPFPPDAKVAFVSLQMVVSESKLGKLGQSQMADFAKKISDDLGVLQKSAADLQKEIDSGILSAAVIQSKRSQLEQLSRDLTHKQEDAQAKLDEYNGQLLNGFSDKVIPIVEELRAERGLWVILGVQDNQGGLAVLAVNPALDLSPEVIKRLDIKYPGTAGK